MRCLHIFVLSWLISGPSYAEVLEYDPNYAVLSDACLSHLDGSVLTWGSGAQVASPGDVLPVAVRYHPLSGADQVPGHVGYQADHDRRSILLRVAPHGSTPPRPPSSSIVGAHNPTGGGVTSGGDVPPQVRWRTQGVRGAAVFGTFTMGTGTTSSRPGFDQYSSIWHGFLEPLVDVWAHLRRLEGNYTSSQSLSAETPGNPSTPSQPVCPRYDVYITDEVLGLSQNWLHGYLVAFWRAFASFGVSGLQSVLDLLDDSTGQSNENNRPQRKRATAAALARGEVAPWAEVAAAPMTCYASVIVGAPCCSRYPFNRRGSEDVLGQFGDCMLEAHHFQSSDSSEGASRSRRGASAQVRVPDNDNSQQQVGPFRRTAATSATTAKVLILDRDECDRRLSNPVEVVNGLRSLGLSQVRHVYFERFTVAEQLAMAADSDLIVAAHGGGEGWMTVMPRNGALVELRFTGNSNCFAPFAKWAKVHRIPVDNLPRFRNTSCVRAVAWAEQRDHIRADWSIVRPAVEEALALTGTPLPVAPQAPQARNAQIYRGRSHDIPIRSSVQFRGIEGTLPNADVRISRREVRRRRRGRNSSDV